MWWSILFVLVFVSFLIYLRVVFDVLYWKKRHRFLIKVRNAKNKVYFCRHQMERTACMKYNNLRCKRSCDYFQKGKVKVDKVNFTYQITYPSCTVFKRNNFKNNC